MFDLVRIALRALVLPKQVLRCLMVRFVNPRIRDTFTQNRKALGAFDSVSEKIPAVGNMPPLRKQRSAIGKGELNGVVVEESASWRTWRPAIP